MGLRASSLNDLRPHFCENIRDDRMLASDTVRDHLKESEWSIPRRPSLVELT